jgi:hypothetical protein
VHADRANRVLLTGIGLIALIIGAAGLVAGFGGFGDHFRHEQVTANGFSRYFADHGNWLWPVIAGVAVVIGLLALVWVLRILFSTDRTGDVRINRTAENREQTKGRTSLQTSALTSTVCSQIESYHGVIGTNARVIGDPGRPNLVVMASISRQSDLPELVRRIDSETFADVRHALGDDQLPIELNLNVLDRPAARTR